MRTYNNNKYYSNIDPNITITELRWRRGESTYRPNEAFTCTCSFYHVRCGNENGVVIEESAPYQLAAYENCLNCFGHGRMPIPPSEVYK